MLHFRASTNLEKQMSINLDKYETGLYHQGLYIN